MMTPLATHLLNQEILRLLNHQATLRNPSSPSHVKGTPSSTSNDKQHCSSRSGVYFNDREVPQDMHVPFISRSVYATPKLPSGKPMPQPPRLMMTTVTRQSLQVREPEVDVSSNKRQQEGEGNHDREPKRLRSGSKSLTTEQEAFIEAALALTSVRNAGQQPISKSSPFHSSTSALRGALPPPPFSLSTRLDVSKPHSDRVAKSA